MNRGHSTTETFIKFIATLIIGATAIFCLLLILNYGIVGAEEHYCYKLQAQAEQYKNFTLSNDNLGGFYITKDDQEMCEGIYNIKIKAVVK